jgi:hypothetical protein
MIKNSFRITSIELDEDEEVLAVTAAASDAALSVITEMLGTAPQVSGGAVTLPVSSMATLHAATGKITGHDPRHKVTTETWDRIIAVVPRTGPTAGK